MIQILINPNPLCNCFQVFQVAYLLLKSGPSPRPSNWVLERSLDGQTWRPWMYFAESDEECWRRFGVEPVHTITGDDQVRIYSEQAWDI